MKNYRGYQCLGLLCLLYLAGCAAVQTESVNGPPGGVGRGPRPEPPRETPVQVQVKQATAIAETALEISKNALQASQEAVNTSKQANATADAAVESANKAIAAANETKEFASQQAEKAINAANDASDRAIAAANKASSVAMEYSDKAVAAANEAVTKSNEAADRAVAAANQSITEANRMRSTIKMAPPDEPIIDTTQPSGKTVAKRTSRRSGPRTYVTKKGDTLESIACRFYGNLNKWERIVEANKDLAKDPHKELPPGTKLRIP